ncbi:MAG: MlaD family protein, partial [Candidatus Puniceispirillales bacterium]
GLIGFLVIISVLGNFMQRTDPYFTQVNNVSGLKTGAAVIYEGYIIGSVSNITPEATADGMSFRIDLDIQKDWRIPKTSEASIAAMSLLSAVAIQIRAGEGPALEPGSMIVASMQSNFVDELSETADNIATIAEENLVPLLNTIDQLLSTHGAETLSGVNELTTGLAREAPEVAANLNRAVNNLDQLIKAIEPERLDRAMGDVETILENSKQASANAADASAAVSNTLVPEATALVRTGNVTVEETRRMMITALERVLADMELISKEISSLTTKTGDIVDTAKNATAKVEGIMDNIDGVVSSSNSVILSGGEQLATIMTRLDRAALNIEEMTAILKNNPGVLITGTE